MLIEHAESAPHDQITFGPQLVGKAKSRRKVVSIRRVDGIDGGSLDDLVCFVNAIYAGSLTVSNDSYDVVSFPSLSTLEKAISQP